MPKLSGGGNQKDVNNSRKKGVFPLVKFFKFWFPLLFYSVIIYIVSGLPKIGVHTPWPFFDKFLHVIEYAVLGLLFARAYHQASSVKGLGRTQIIIATVLFCFLYGLSDEFHQMFVEGRYATIGDLTADTIGGLIAGYFYRS